MNYFNPTDDNNQQNKDFSDWRNIQLASTTTTTATSSSMTTTSTTMFDLFGMPTWPLPNFPPINFNFPTQQDEIIDLTDPSTSANDFIPIQNHASETDVILLPETNFDELLDEIETVIPDIDLDYARRTITSMNPLPSINELVTQFLDNGYTRKSKQSSTNLLKRSWTETIDDIPKFLSLYSDPIEYFYNNQRKQSELYINHSKAFLLRAFPTVDKSVLEEILREENYHFLPTCRKLEERLGIRTNAFLQRTAIRKSLEMLDHSSKLPSTSWIIKNNKFAYAIPHTPCEEFYDELRFAKNEGRIRRHLGKLSKEHEKRVKKAKKAHGTLECGICYRDDLLIDDMVECTNGHLACRSCVRIHVNVCFKEGKSRFSCVENSCSGEYALSLIEQLLPPKDLNRLHKRIQEENIRQAGIDGLECCPYCPYAVIVDNPDDKVFRCLNPECMKETCRLCKESNHIPLRCDEVEKGVELEMRKFIEEHVSEAMIRKCPRCTQRFYKVEGCNKMTCSSCGLFICYVCRETINGYDHFTNNEKCTLSNQSEKLHYEEMVEAYRNAKLEYLRLHPDAQAMILRYDPISHLIKPSDTSTHSS